ncbi:MAG TPA: SpoIIE family protein phosphatase, partial [Firmicutes bacterium]|nr:SpoIIE family protein phosphatase [Bacillota bacterium]
AASHGGIVAGSVAGTILGAVLSMSQGVAFPLTGALVAGGLVAGMLSGYGRVYAACGFFLAAGVFSHEISSASGVMPFIIALASSSVIFMLMPAKWLWRLPALETGAPDNVEAASTTRDRRLAEIASYKLEQIRDIFDDLSRDLAAVPDLAGLSERARLVSLLNDIARRRCSRCIAYLACWRDNFHRTYRDVLDLVALAELKGPVTVHDVQASAGSWCLEGGRLAQAINESLGSMVQLAGREGFYEGRRTMSQQLRGIADIMKGLVTELSTAMSFDSERETRLRRELLRAGLPVRELSLIYHAGGRYEIIMDKDGCGGVGECRKAIVPVMSSILGERVSISSASCALEGGRPTCSIKLIPTTRLRVRATQVGLPRFGGTISGDTALVSELSDGRSLLVISDGMGSGQEAALQSKAAVSMLKRLVEAGFGHEFAARTTNSLLLLRSPGETFATVDSVVVDLYSGRAEFIKIGSSPSFVKRRRSVEVVRSRSLPAGILAPADIEKVTVGLRPGDLLVMVSDGIFESRKNGIDSEQWLVRLLRKFDSDDPQEIAELLVEEAKRGADKGFPDDLTLIVARVDLYTDISGDILRTGRWNLTGTPGKWGDSQFETYSQAGWFA